MLQRLTARLAVATVLPSGDKVSLGDKLLCGCSRDVLSALAVGKASFDDAWYRVAYASRFEPVLRLSCQDKEAALAAACRNESFQADLDDFLYYYFTMQPHGSLQAVLRRGNEWLARDKAADAGNDDEEETRLRALDFNCPWGDEAGLHLVILTEQHPSRWQAQRVERELQGAGKVVKALPLDQITSEDNILESASWLYGEQAPGAEQAVLVLLSHSNMTHSLLCKTLFLCAEERRRCIATNSGRRAEVQRH
eukprot:5659575-Amphidinium_carterae.1